MQYVNVLLWVLMIVLITAIGCSAVAILWVETQKEKWIESGRELGLEDREVKFKKTSGTRRVKRDTILEDIPEEWTTELQLRLKGHRSLINKHFKELKKPPKTTVTKSKRESTN